MSRTAGIRLRQSEAPQALSSAAVKALGTSEGQMVFGYSREDSKRSIWALRMSLWPNVTWAMDNWSLECHATVARVLYGCIDVCSCLILLVSNLVDEVGTNSNSMRTGFHSASEHLVSDMLWVIQRSRPQRMHGGIGQGEAICWTVDSTSKNSNFRR